MSTRTEKSRRAERRRQRKRNVRDFCNYSMKKCKRERFERECLMEPKKMMKGSLRDMAKGDIMSSFQRNTVTAKAILAKIVSLQQDAPEPLTMEATELTEKMKKLQERIEERLEILKAIPKTTNPNYSKESVIEQMSCLVEIYESIEESVETLEEGCSSDEEDPNA